VNFILADIRISKDLYERKQSATKSRDVDEEEKLTFSIGVVKFSNSC